MQLQNIINSKPIVTFFALEHQNQCKYRRIYEKLSLLVSVITDVIVDETKSLPEYSEWFFNFHNNDSTASKTEIT